MGHIAPGTDFAGGWFFNLDGRGVALSVEVRRAASKVQLLSVSLNNQRRSL